MRRQFKVFVTARAFFGGLPPAVSGPPANGDENPYGVVNVPRTIGKLVRGDTLVSNFNNSSDVQGTGTTIVQIPPAGSLAQAQTFAQIDPDHLPGDCPGGIGLTTALRVLAGGFVVVGSLPVPQMGNPANNPGAGCLIVLNSQGAPVGTWSGGDINGPWDMTSLQLPGFAELFVTSVLNGTVQAGLNNEVDQGTVIRILVATPPGLNPIMLGTTVIGTGFAEELNTAAVVLGPTGVALGHNGTLYVADTVKSRIAKIPFATLRVTPITGGGITLASGNPINGPLGMTLAPNGDIITVNGGDGNAVETTPEGAVIGAAPIDPLSAPGDLFGLTVAPGNRGVLFVDDGSNTLDILGQDGGAYM